MPDSRIRALVIADQRCIAESIRTTVEGCPQTTFQVALLPTFPKDASCFPDEEFDLILMHLTNNGRDGSEWVEFLQEHTPETPLVVITDAEETSHSLRTLTADVDDVLELQQLRDPLFTRCLLHAIERRRLQGQVLRLTLHDPLTELANRTLFSSCCERALFTTQQDVDYSFAVMVVDLDHFQRVNDSLGHE